MEEVMGTSSLEEDASGSVSYHGIGHACFAPLQSRRLASPPVLSASAMCPSMDLVALGLSTKPSGPDLSSPASVAVDEAVGATSPEAISIPVATQLSVHRTVSWQKLVSWTAADLALASATTENAAVPLSTALSSPPPPEGATALCWSPDGRCVALALTNGEILLYAVEDSTNGGVDSHASLGGVGGGNGGILLHSIPPASPFARGTATPNEYTTTETTQDTNTFDAGPTPVRHSNDEPPFSPGSALPSPAVTRSMAAQRRRYRALARMKKTPMKQQQHIQRPPTTPIRKSPMVQTPVSPFRETHHQHDEETLGWKAGAVTEIYWTRLGRRHSLWTLEQEEAEREESWRYRKRYLDRASHFLPPCAYNPKRGPVEDANFSGDSSLTASVASEYRINCSTPLSILCVSTVANGIHLYIHGRYHILSLPSLQNDDGSLLASHRGKLTVSTDLSTIIALTPTSDGVMRMKLYSFPLLCSNRYDLQSISALYCSVSTHLKVMEGSMKEIVAMWMGALKPLDVKFENLAKMLQDYNVLPSISPSASGDDAANGGVKTEQVRGMKAQLLNYILIGHSGETSQVSNAIDQFFTGVQMNDQLLQRMARTLEGNVAHMESAVRKKILGPARALVYDAIELNGLAHMMASSSSLPLGEEQRQPPLLDLETSTKMQQACEILAVTGEQFVSDIVEARFRLKDMLAWIRGTASQVKARGTASDSALRENARKRRVSDSGLRRFADYLSAPVMDDTDLLEHGNHSQKNDGKRSLTECILSAPISEYITRNVTYVLRETDRSQTNSPTSALSFGLGSDSHTKIASKVPTVKSALNTASMLLTRLFEQPRKALGLSVNSAECLINGTTPFGNIGSYEALSLHKRIGLDKEIPNERSDESSPGYFQPLVVSATGLEGTVLARDWIVFGMAGESKKRGECSNILQIIACPTGSHRSTMNESDRSATDLVDSPPSISYLTSFIVLPDNCVVKDVSFYGDDGNSSLSCVADETCEEGRQGITMLVHRYFGDENGGGDDSYVEGSRSQETLSEEIWMFKYDSIRYQMCQGDDKGSRIDEGDSNCTWVYPQDNIPDLRDDGKLVIFARRRQLRVGHEAGAEVDQSSSLVLSGSRGIGGVFTCHSGAGLELFDLEEDDDDDESEELGESMEE